jgi:hypothetical protein
VLLNATFVLWCPSILTRGNSKGSFYMNLGWQLPSNCFFLSSWPFPSPMGKNNVYQLALVKDLRRFFYRSPECARPLKCISFSVQLPSIQCSVPQILVVSASLNAELYLLSWEIRLCLGSYCTTVEKVLPGRKTGCTHRDHLISLPSLMNHSPIFPTIQYSKIIVVCILPSFLLAYGWKTSPIRDVSL